MYLPVPRVLAKHCRRDDQPIKLSRVKIQNMPLKFGIAFYILEGNNRTGPPHQALVAHPIHYSAPDVMVFQIHLVLTSSWCLAHTVCSLINALTLLGVLHVAEISMTSVALNQFVAQFPATTNGDDPSRIPVWFCENWVIGLGVLHHLSQTTMPVLRLPVQYDPRRASDPSHRPKEPAGSLRCSALQWLLEVGNTHVTCHVGVPSCGQRQRNVFIT